MSTSTFYCAVFVALSALLASPCLGQGTGLGGETIVVKTVTGQPPPPALPTPYPAAPGQFPKVITTVTIRPGDLTIVPPAPRKIPPIVTLGKYPAALVGAKILPPADYDHHYEGHLIIKIADTYEQLQKECQPHKGALACARLAAAGDSCIVWIVKDEVIKARGYTTDIIMRHEIGHCNGWPGFHPDARPLPAQ